MERHRRVYSWVWSMLAHLYHNLGEYVFGQGCTLLQVWMLEHITCTRPGGAPIELVPEQPRVYAYSLTHEWRFSDLLYWRLSLDRLTAGRIIWRPYLRMSMWVGIRKQMFNMQRNRLLEERYSHIVIPFYFDQVQWQFGFKQCVPTNVPVYI